MFQGRFQSVPGPINVGAVVKLDLVTDSDCVEIRLLTTQHSGGSGGGIGHAAIRGWDLEKGKNRIQLTLMVTQYKAASPESKASRIAVD